MDLCDRREIQALLERHGFHFSKAMGQNFLIEGWVPRDIADASGADERTGVLEIGPGIGPLTAQLVHRAAKVASVELDVRLYPVLRETMSGADNFTLIEGDAMKLDFPQVIQEHFAGLRPILCANLPYNITTPILTKCVESRCFDSLTVLIQKEVAERICARAGTAEYGAFTVLMQYYTDPAAVHRPPHLLPARPQGDLRRDPLSRAEGAASGRGVRVRPVADGEGRLRPAAKNAGELSANRLPAAQGAADGNRHRLRSGALRPWRTPDAGGLRPPHQRPIRRGAGPVTFTNPSRFFDGMYGILVSGNIM